MDAMAAAASKMKNETASASTPPPLARGVIMAEHRAAPSREQWGATDGMDAISPEVA